jgi:hypothetical protein
MRFTNRLLAALFGLALGAAVLLGSGADAAASSAGPDAPAVAVRAEAAPAALPPGGTDLESRDYALREAAAPELQEFEGGTIVIVSIGFFGLLLIILILILIAGD